MADFTSLDPDPNPQPTGAGGGGGCFGRAGVLRAQWRQGAGNEPAYAALDAAHLVFLDAARGLVVADVAAEAPRLVGRLPMTPHAGDLHVAGSYALVSRRGPKPYAAYFANGYPEIDEGAELLVVDLTDVTQPHVVDRVVPEHPPDASFLVQSGGTARLYVFSAGSCGDDGVGRLISYELAGARLARRGELDLTMLGPTLTIRQIGSDLAVANAALASAQLTLISLASADGAMTVAPPIALAGALLEVHADGPDTLRVLSAAPGSGLRIEHLDIRDRAAPVRLHECVVPAPFGSVVFASYGATHTFLASPASGTGNSSASVGTGQDGMCEVRAASGGVRSIIALERPPARAVELVRNMTTNEFGVTLLDETDLSVLDELSFQLAPGFVTGYGASVLGAAASSESSETGLLAVALQPPLSYGTPPGLQLFSVTAERARARGAVSASGRVLEGLPQALTWSAHGLSRLELDDLDAPALSEPADVAPLFARLWSFPAHWVRLRTSIDGEWETAGPEDVSDAELLSPALHARLEIVPVREDPDRGAPIASVDVNPRARFIRVGELIVSVLSRSGDQPEPTQIEVFDLRDPERPRKAGALSVPALWLPDNVARRLGSYWGELNPAKRCLDCAGQDLDTRALAVPEALVLRTLHERRPTLQVLDLSDPDAPVLSDAIAQAPEELALSAFAEGSSVYATSREHAAVEEDGMARSRFSFRRIDLSRPSRPVVGARINVPGQLVAVAGDQLYTREFVMRDGRHETLVHRLVLRDGRAEPAATHSFGGRMAFALALDGRGHLIADLGEPLSDFFSGGSYQTPPTELQVLDAQTLALLGEAQVGRYGRRVDLRGERALYSAAEGYVLMDLSEPGAPHFAHYFAVFQARRASLLEDSVLIQDGALTRYAAEAPFGLRDGR